jgi:hypothetical protein
LRPLQLEVTLTSSAKAAPLARLRPPAGRFPLWQLVVQLVLKMGCICAAKLTLGPQPTQVPERQSSPLAQIVPQPPQFPTSVLVLTQVAPQSVVPPPHDTVHPPFTQDAPEAQACPQAPQFCESVVVFTQLDPQAESPDEQRQLPPAQELPAGQG